MAKRGLGKGLGAFFGEEVTTTKENAAEKVSRSERAVKQQRRARMLKRS